MSNYYADYYTLSYAMQIRANRARVLQPPDRQKLSLDDFEDQQIRTIVTNGLPLGHFEDIEVQRTFLCGSEGKMLQFLSASTAKRRIMSIRESIRVQVLQRLPKEPQRIAIGLDGWTDQSTQAFIAIKAFWIEQGATKWTHEEALLAFVPFTGRHSGESIADVVKETLSFYGITDRVQSYTMDNASNNKTMYNAMVDLGEEMHNAMADLGEALDEEDYDPFRKPYIIPCLAHVIQLGGGAMTLAIKVRPTNEELQLNFDQQLNETGLAALKPRSQISEEDVEWIPYTLFKVSSLVCNSHCNSLTVAGPLDSYRYECEL